MISAVFCVSLRKFDTSVICHVFIYFLVSFLLQDMLLTFHVFAFEGQTVKFTDNPFAYLHSNSILRRRALQ